MILAVTMILYNRSGNELCT